MADEKFVLAIGDARCFLRVQAPLPLTEEVWKHITGLVDAMRPALVETAEPTRGEEAPP